MNCTGPTETAAITGDADILGTIQKRLPFMGDDALLDALGVERENEIWLAERHVASHPAPTKEVAETCY